MPSTFPINQKPRAALERLARVRVLLPTDDPDFQWLAAALDRYLIGAANSLEAALCLKCRGTPARDLEKGRRRDLLIREFAQMFSDNGVPAAAKGVSARLDAYRNRCWPREQRIGHPAGKGPAHALLFAIFNEAGGKVPRTPKQIARILRSGHSVPHRMSEPS